MDNNVGKDILYLVYDNWDYEKNLPYQSNCKDLYQNCFHMTRDSPIITISYPKNDIIRIPIYDVFKYPDKPLIYLICLLPNLISTKLINNENPISDECIYFWRKYKNFKVLIMNEQESEDFETFRLLDTWTKSINLDQSQLWMSNNNTKLNEYKNQLKSNINVYTTNTLPNSIARSMYNSFGEIKFKPNKNGDFFMCYNRRARPHRYGLLCLLKKYDVLYDTDWSLVNGWQIKSQHYTNFYNDVFTQSDINDLSSEIEYFYNIDQKKSNYEVKHDWFDDRNEIVSWGIIYEKETFENSYVNITTESQFDQSLIHISEKSFKAFFAMQFPLILASPNHISEIRKRYNFDFFDDVIDHSYDEEINNRDRLFKFAKEVKRIHDNKDFFINFYKKNEYRFIENNIKSLKYSKDTSDLLFLKNITKIK